MHSPPSRTASPSVTSSPRRWRPPRLATVPLGLVPLGLGLLGSATLVPACESTPPTEVVVEVYTDLPCPAVAAVAAGKAGELGDRDASAVSTVCDPETGSLGRLVIVPRESDDAEVALEVRVRTDDRPPDECVESKGYSGCIVARRILNYIPGRSVRLRVDLRDPCVDVPCTQTTTCVAQGTTRACVEARVDPTQCEGACTDADLLDQHEGTFARCGGDDDPCGEGATCVLIGDEARCLCPSGYTLEEDTQSCVDVDECDEDLHDCDANARCENTPGSFECHCEDGYEGDGQQCTSLCPSDCSDDSTCQSVGGELLCVCNDGYQGDGTTCTDLNECSQGLHDCVSPAVCVNEPGGFSCVCPGALELQGTNTCVCPDTQVFCDGACIDPATDPQYCGASGTCTGASAGTTCPLAQSCIGGACDYPTPLNVLVRADTAAPILAALARMGVDDVVETAEPTFADAYDAQEWDLVIVDLSNTGTTLLKERVLERVGTGKLIFNYWNLDEDTDLMFAFGVSCDSVDLPPELAPLPSAPVDLFAFRETFPAPLVSAQDRWADSGDVFTLTGPGDALVSRHGSPTEAFIVQTNDGSTILNGFLPGEYVSIDADADGVDDITELFVNEITWLFR